MKQLRYLVEKLPPGGAAEPPARSGRALPLARAALGDWEPDRCPSRLGWPPWGASYRLGWGLVFSPAIAEGRWREGREDRGWERREGSRRAGRGGGKGRGGAARSWGQAGRGAGRVGTERESNSRTRPERLAPRAQAAWLRPRPLRRSRSNVSPARAPPFIDAHPCP